MSTKLNIQDLTPQKVEFNLTSLPGITLILSPWSLRVKAWAIDKYGEGELQKIMVGMKTVKIAEITYFMLTSESKKHVPTLDDYLGSIQKVTDEITINKALLKSMGIGEPEIEKLSSSDVTAVNLDPKKAKPRKKNA